MADNSRAVNRVFTRKVICDLIENGRSDVFDYVVKRYIDDPSSKNHGQLISKIYAHLNKQQRNLYCYCMTSRSTLTPLLLLFKPQSLTLVCRLRKRGMESNNIRIEAT